MFKMAQLVEHSGEERFFAILSYISLLFLIPLLMKKDNIWIHRHAKQGLVMFLVGFLVWIPLLGWALGLYLFVVWIIVIVKVLMGSPFWKIPGIGYFADKLKI